MFSSRFYSSPPSRGDFSNTVVPFDSCLPENTPLFPWAPYLPLLPQRLAMSDLYEHPPDMCKIFFVNSPPLLAMERFGSPFPQLSFLSPRCCCFLSIENSDLAPPPRLPRWDASSRAINDIDVPVTALWNFMASLYGVLSFLVPCTRIQFFCRIFLTPPSA